MKPSHVLSLATPAATESAEDLYKLPKRQWTFGTRVEITLFLSVLLLAAFLLGVVTGWILVGPVCQNGAGALFSPPAYICGHLPKSSPRQTRSSSPSCPTRRTTAKWSGCSRSCGNGEDRLFECVRLHDPVSNEPLTPPKCSLKRTRACARRDCPIGLVYGNWSSCSSLCGIGTRRRSVKCAQRLSRGMEITYQDRQTECGEEPWPTADHEEEACTGRACPYRWDTERWSACSAVCGDGEQTRRVFCTEITKGRRVNTSKCTGLKKPVSARACRTASRRQCPKWVTGNWTCNSSCGHPGRLVRRVECKLDGLSVRTTNCPAISAPVAEGEACSGECPPEPRVRVLRPVTIARVGGQVQLECKVSGRPRPHVEWVWTRSVDHRPHQLMRAEMAQGRIRYLDHNTVFVIDSVRAEHAGTYTCLAKNIRGVATATGQLRVTEEPDQSRGGSSLSAAQQRGFHFTIRCNVTCGIGWSDGIPDCHNGQGQLVPARDCIDHGVQPPMEIVAGRCDAGPCRRGSSSSQYSWSDWSACNANCLVSQTGKRTRTCQDINAKVVSPSHCSQPGENNSISIPCRLSKCVAWRQTIVRGPCSVTCGEGHALGIAKCFQRKRSGQWRKHPSPDEECAGLPKPTRRLMFVCVKDPCRTMYSHMSVGGPRENRGAEDRHRWVRGRWSACEGVFRTRTVHCVAANESRADDVKCLESERKPASRDPCYVWRTGEWSQCGRQTCLRRRNVTCARSNQSSSEKPSPRLCVETGIAKPATKQACSDCDSTGTTAASAKDEVDRSPQQPNNCRDRHERCTNLTRRLCLRLPYRKNCKCACQGGRRRRR